MLDFMDHLSNRLSNPYSGQWFNSSEPSFVFLCMPRLIPPINLIEGLRSLLALLLIDHEKAASELSPVLIPGSSGIIGYRLIRNLLAADPFCKSML